MALDVQAYLALLSPENKPIVVSGRIQVSEKIINLIVNSNTRYPIGLGVIVSANHMRTLEIKNLKLYWNR